jgi:hypothetical protein
MDYFIITVEDIWKEDAEDAEEAAANVSNIYICIVLIY